MNIKYKILNDMLLNCGLEVWVDGQPETKRRIVVPNFKLLCGYKDEKKLISILQNMHNITDITVEQDEII